MNISLRNIGVTKSRCVQTGTPEWYQSLALRGESDPHIVLMLCNLESSIQSSGYSPSSQLWTSVLATEWHCPLENDGSNWMIDDVSEVNWRICMFKVNSTAWCSFLSTSFFLYYCDSYGTKSYAYWLYIYNKVAFVWQLIFSFTYPVNPTLSQVLLPEGNASWCMRTTTELICYWIIHDKQRDNEMVQHN